MSAIQAFNYNNHTVRTVEKDGEPWFVLKDVCGVLGITKYRDAADRLDADEREPVRVDTLGGAQEMIAVNESGLYSVILRSDKPEAKPFRAWVTKEVLPSIRKHGAYMTPETLEAAILNPDTMIRILTELKAEREQRKTLEAKAEQDKPKVLFAAAVEASKTSILVGDLAKLVRQNGVNFGQNRLFAWLRENGFLIKSGERYNMPSQYSMERQLMEIKERTINNPDGSIRITKTPKITGKGQTYFVNRLLAEFGTRL